MGGRWLGWWRVAVGTAASLSHPRVDPAAADADIYDIIANSRLFDAGATALAAMRRTWIHSRVHRGTERLSRQAGATAPADRIRFAARCTMVMAVTVLALLGAGTATGRRFMTLLPVAGGVLALIADCSAEAIARAWLGKQR